MKMAIGNKEIDFVFQGDRVIYPNPVMDGLVAWYDFKAMRNSDVTRGVALDLSGTGNDGVLRNFAFDGDSGYEDGLNFDGVDDMIGTTSVVPLNGTKQLSLMMTLSANSKIESNNFIYESGLDYATVGKIYVVSTATGALEALINLTGAGGGGFLTIRFPFAWGVLSNICLIYDTEQINSIDMIKLYVNGGKIEGAIATNTARRGSSFKDYTHHIFNRVNASLNTQGSLKSSMLYNRALTPSEIQHNYQVEKQRWNIQP